MSNILNTMSTPIKLIKSKKIITKKQPKSKSITTQSKSPVNNKMKLQIKSYERNATHLLLSQILELTNDECNLIEENIYNWASGYETGYLSAYLNKSSSILTALKTEDKHLIKLIKSLNLQKNYDDYNNLNNLSNLSLYDINPSLWNELFIEQQKINNNITKLLPNSDRFTCNKCNLKECFTYFKQDRSSDESMTLHIICCNISCNNMWTCN